jgi:hypothetical protein
VYITPSTNVSLTNGGTYTLTGPGGKQVGPFTATATLPASFSVPNLSSLATINRAQPLTVNWTGTGFDQVLILLQSALLTTSTTHGVNIQCAVPAAPGTYTIPPAVLAYLLPTTGSGSVGQMSVSTATNNGGIATAETTTGLTANIPLVAGGQIDFGGFGAFLSVGQSVTIQ